MRKIIVAWFGLLLLAAPVQAQFIDCGPGGADCSEDLYGLGNDPVEGPIVNTTGTARQGPPGGSCGPERQFRHQGQIRIREQDNCAVSATTRCQVEIPQIADDSGWFSTNQDVLDLGPGGIVAVLVGSLTDLSGNVGYRQLSGTCTLDEGQECGLDSDCPAGAGCRSTCNSSPGTTCASQADCPAADCRTELEWDGIGLCTDNATVCSSDAECSGGDVCLAGFEWRAADSACTCCQSSLGTLCAVLTGWGEYPTLTCGGIAADQFGVGIPDWIFDGGRGTRFEHERIQVPGQLEGVCNGNRSRPCGALGDAWAGAANGKCTSGTAGCAGDPFNPDDLALASDCADVAFGGAEGDFCDLTEQGIRTLFGRNDDGTHNIAICAQTVSLVGTPGELCALPNDIPEGDPQPGCRLFNIGVVPEPDLDCSGIADTEEGRCMPLGGAICSDPALCPPCTSDADCTPGSGNCVNQGDLCPFMGEANWFLDSNNDDIGDECQCGDGNGDGAITGVDISAVAVCANDPLSNPICDATIVDATGDNATTAEDIGGIVAAVNGTIPTSALECVRNLDTTLP